MLDSAPRTRSSPEPAVVTGRAAPSLPAGAGQSCRGRCAWRSKAKDRRLSRREGKRRRDAEGGASTQHDTMAMADPTEGATSATAAAIWRTRRATDSSTRVRNYEEQRDVKPNQQRRGLGDG